MPRVSRRSHRRRVSYNDLHMYQLLAGHGFFTEDLFGHHLNPDLVAIEKAWRLLQDDLLSLHVSKLPGTRPWAWWVFDAPEPRQCIEGEHDCPRRDESMLRDNKTTYFGRSPIYACPQCWEECHETQTAYLFRLNLLTPEEREIIPDDYWWPYEEDHQTLSMEEIKRWGSRND